VLVAIVVTPSESHSGLPLTPRTGCARLQLPISLRRGAIAVTRRQTGDTMLLPGYSEDVRGNTSCARCCCSGHWEHAHHGRAEAQWYARPVFQSQPPVRWRTPLERRTRERPNDFMRAAFGQSNLVALMSPYYLSDDP